MRQIIFLFFIGLLFFSCAVTQPTSSVVGTYSGKTPASLEWIPSGNATLILKHDGVFNLKWRRWDNSEIQRLDFIGNWRKINETHIWLDFDEVDLTIQLSTHAISYEDREIELVGNNKIKIDNFVLKRERK